MKLRDDFIEDVSSVMLNVILEIYYAKSMIYWDITNHLYNLRLEVDFGEGWPRQTEFEEVKLDFKPLPNSDPNRL